MPLIEPKKEKLDNKEIEATLTKSSQKILKDFLTPYADSSKINVKNAILTSYYNIGKNDFSNWNYSDYIKVITRDMTGDFITKKSYLKSFFKYLFIFDILKDNSNFKWIKEEELRDYHTNNRKGDREAKTKIDYSLTLEEIFSIQSVVDTDVDDLQTLKMQFAWFAIFELGIKIEFLRKVLDAKEHYIDEELIIDGQIIKIPEKFHVMFQKLNGREDYSGFATTDALLEQLGKFTGLTRKLIPKDIKISREKLMIECGNCKCRFMNIAENWVAINGRIACNECGEILKKKFNFQLAEIEQFNVDISNTSRTAIFQQFEKLKEKLKNTTIDYLKIHEFQIEVGKLGEIFAYNFEREKLAGTKYIDKIDRTKSLDASNGYDILSYDLKGKEICIEVKCTVNSDPVFYISTPEVDMYKKVTESGGKYHVYLITDILTDRPRLTVIENLLDDERLVFKENGWKVELQDSLMIRI